jgi:hypothetical protein
MDEDICHFLTLLNLDCRILIYLDVLQEGVYNFVMLPHDWTRGARLKAKSGGPNRFNLMRLCRQIYHESKTLPFKYNIFNLGTPMNLQEFSPTFINKLQVDAITTLAFAVNVNNPTKVNGFMSNVRRLALPNLRAKAPGVNLVYLHSLQRHWRSAKGDWDSKMGEAKWVFQEWERNPILLSYQQWVSGKDMPNGRSKVKIIFHIILNDGRHFDKDSFSAGPIQEIDKSRIEEIEEDCIIEG